MTSVRLLDDMRERYNQLARQTGQTGQTRNSLIVTAMAEYIGAGVARSGDSVDLQNRTA